MKRAEQTFSQVSDLSFFVDLFEINVERTISVSRGDEQTHDRVPRDLDICFERFARVSEKLFVLVSTIQINNVATDLRVPTVLLACSRIKVDRVAIFSRLGV